MTCPKCNQDIDKIYATPELICRADNVINLILHPLILSDKQLSSLS